MSTTAHRKSPSLHRSRGGFTLVEILVAIGIIVLLLSLAVPAIMSSYRKARALKSAADLQAIAAGLEAYHMDFGDYPRVSMGGTGFAVLGKALISPGPAGGPLPALGSAPYAAGTYTSTGTPGAVGYTEYVCFGAPDTRHGGFFSTLGTSDVNTWAPLYVSDGKDGPGFRARSGGKTFGPYLQADKFKLQGLAILDGWGNPILYFPASTAKVAHDTTGGKTWPLITGGPGSVYNATDNVSFFLRYVSPGSENIAADSAKALKRMDGVIVHDSVDFDGTIQAGESAATTGPFLLWSAGPDGNFGVTYDTANTNPTKQEVSKCDDVTNFGQ